MAGLGHENPSPARFAGYNRARMARNSSPSWARSSVDEVPARLDVMTTAVPSRRTAATMAPVIVELPCWPADVATYADLATDTNRELGAPNRVIGERVSSSRSGLTSS